MTPAWPVAGTLTPMNIGLLTLEIFISDSQSLKDKRMVVRSLKDRLRKFNVSVAECEHQNLWQRSTLGVVSVASDPRILEQTLNSVLRASEEILERNLANYQIEYL
jgi:uncharacterized protein YlxP (DUF503 family)